MNDSEKKNRPNAGGEANGAVETGRGPTGKTSTTDREQPSALGGDVAARSGVGEAPDLGEG